MITGILLWIAIMDTVGMLFGIYGYIAVKRWGK